MQKLFQKFRVLNVYLLAALILAIPLYQKFPFIRVPGTFVSIRMEDFLVLISVLIFLTYNIRNIKKYLKNPVFLAVIFFFMIAFFSLFSAVFVTQTVNPFLSLVHFLRRIEYLSLLFFGYFAISVDRKRLPFYINLLLVVVFIAFFYGIGQRFFNWPIVITQNEEYSKGIALRYVSGSHINSTFAGHYDLATYLVMVMPLMLGMFFYLKNGLKKYLFLLAYFCGLWLLVNTASRISMVSLLLSVGLLAILLKKIKLAIPILLISVLFIGFSSNLISRYERLFQIFNKSVKNILTYDAIPSAYAQSDDTIQRRFSPEPTPTPPPVFEDRSTSIRLNVEWPRAIRALTKNPLFGTGYSSITLASDNDYLRALGETGILGFLAFALIFIWLIIYFLRSFRDLKDSERVFVYAVFASFLGILLNAVFIDIFEASKLALSFWLLMGISLYLMEGYAKDN